MLTEFPEESTLFYLYPIYKHQSDRDNFVYYGEEFFLMSHLKFLNEQLYFHVSRNTKEQLLMEEMDNAASKTSRGDEKVPTWADS